MKKLLSILVLSITLISCDGIDNKDKLLSTIIESDTKHLQRYNTLQKISKDTSVVNYISKLKDSLKLEAIEAKGTLSGASGIYFGSLTKSQILVEDYIKLCKLSQQDVRSVESFLRQFKYSNRIIDSYFPFDNYMR